MPPHRTFVRRWSPLIAVLAGLGACATRGAPPTDDSVSGGSDAAQVTTGLPHLNTLRPDTIALARGEVPMMILTGSGFVPGPTGTFATGVNRVRVGRATIEGIAADSSGTVLRFSLPLSYTDTTAKGRPSSFSPGQYPVSVVTPRGTSNTLTLTMIP